MIGGSHSMATASPSGCEMNQEPTRRHNQSAVIPCQNFFLQGPTFHEELEKKLTKLKLLESTAKISADGSKLLLPLIIIVVNVIIVTTVIIIVISECMLWAVRGRRLQRQERVRVRRRRPSAARAAAKAYPSKNRHSKCLLYALYGSNWSSWRPYFEELGNRRDNSHTSTRQALPVSFVQHASCISCLMPRKFAKGVSRCSSKERLQREGPWPSVRLAYVCARTHGVSCTVSQLEFNASKRQVQQRQPYYLLCACQLFRVTRDALHCTSKHEDSSTGSLRKRKAQVQDDGVWDLESDHVSGTRGRDVRRGPASEARVGWATWHPGAFPGVPRLPRLADICWAASCQQEHERL